MILAKSAIDKNQVFFLHLFKRLAIVVYDGLLAVTISEVMSGRQFEGD